jgi:hypothetical protein
MVLLLHQTDGSLMCQIQALREDRVMVEMIASNAVNDSDAVGHSSGM